MDAHAEVLNAPQIQHLPTKSFLYLDGCTIKGQAINTDIRINTTCLMSVFTTIAVVSK